MNRAPRAAVIVVVSLWAAGSLASDGRKSIDRQALVSRHNPRLEKPDPLAPLSVGNGEFAFTVDITGLQSFDVFHREGMPLATQAQWGWHTQANPAGYSVANFPFTDFDTHDGRKVPLFYSTLKGRREEVRWLRANPHKLHLGRVGFSLRTSTGEDVVPEELQGIEQTLDLYNGVIHSRFELEGQEVRVRTSCHPRLDLIAVRAESALLRRAQLRVVLEFPYGVGALPRNFQSWSKRTADWSRPHSHETVMRRGAGGRVDFERRLDGDRYHVALECSSIDTLSQLGRHKFILVPGARSQTLEFVCGFSPAALPSLLPTVSEVEAAARDHFKGFWSEGGALELASSSDPRAHELERRIVLSQYLTAIQCAGSLPPQESGLTHNTWHGKYHLEMHWWHAAHFALWNRLALLERSLPFYHKLLPIVRARAKRQGYEGARWIKCSGPAGVIMPSYVEPFLIWHQPHPIYYAELCYRARGDRATLEKYKDIVFESARFMSSFAAWDEAGGRYVLGPPVVPASEIYLRGKETARNPAYSLGYWDFGLEVAQKWRQRLGLERDERWDHVIEHLSALPTTDGVYVELESTPDSFAHCQGHPSFVAPLGILPGRRVDRETMRRTLLKVAETWDWENTWGWDFPMLAMTAARLGEGKLAIDMLMKEARGNRWLPNGHCYQFDDAPAYLPANGGLLMAVAMMAAGWDGGPKTDAPGFPSDGSWTVRWEGLRPMPWALATVAVFL